MTPYQPISCDLYDYIEIAVMRKSPVKLDYVVNGKIETIEATIIDTVTNDKAEYIKVQGREDLIRMDHIQKLDGRRISFTCNLG